MNVTVNEQLLLFPQLSVALQTTVCTPGEETSDGGTQTTVGFGSRSSVTVGLKKSRTMVLPGQRQLKTRFVGHTMDGGVMSRMTVTVKLQDRVLPQSSVAVQTTVLVPAGNELPDAGTQVTSTRGSTGTHPADFRHHSLRLAGPADFRHRKQRRTHASKRASSLNGFNRNHKSGICVPVRSCRSVIGRAPN